MKNKLLCEFARCFDEIDKASGILLKKSILEENKNNKFVRFFCECVFDFYKTMGVTISLKEPAFSKGWDVFFEEFSDEDVYFNKLSDFREKLIKREITGKAAKDLLKSYCKCLPYFVGKYVMMAFNRKSVIGLGAGTVCKIYADLKPAAGVQSARGKIEDIEIGDFAELKVDGIREYIFFNEASQEYEVYSRGQRKLNSYNHELIIYQLKYLGLLTKEYVIDGEITGVDWNEAVSLAKTMTDLSDEDRGKMVFYVFDRIPKCDFFERKETEDYITRRKNIEEMWENIDSHYPLTLVDSTEITKENNAWNITKNYLKNQDAYYGNIEGSVVKKRHSYYGERYQNQWIKVKPRETEDFLILGYCQGEGRLEGTLGSLILDVDGNEVHCGTGYSDDQRKQLWEMRESLKGNYAEVEYLCKTKDNSLREPSFQRLREAWDKPVK